MMLRSASHRAKSDGRSIRFILGAYAPRPVGGFRIVYEYANRLDAEGWDVSIVYLAPPPPAVGLPRYESPRALASYAKTISRARRAPAGGWFDLSPRVRVSVLPRGLYRHAGRGVDVIVATAFPTAPLAYEAARRHGIRGLFLVQHLEDWFEGAAADDVRRAWALPLHKVAISRWLADEIAAVGEAERTSYVPNGIALEAYGIDVAPEVRRPDVVAMMTSSQAWKGHAWGLEALARVREQVPGLRVVLFGDGVDPSTLPGWVNHVGSVDTAGVRRVLNEASIFVHTSDSEGWGLPPAEAMACGTAVVAADNDGVKDYAVDGRNAVLIPRRDVGALADAVVALSADTPRRLALIAQGRVDIAAYSWDRAVRGMTEAVELARPLGNA
jgi:glycosyltransferase involved in cell wall biosynthesis